MPGPEYLGPHASASVSVPSPRPILSIDTLSLAIFTDEKSASKHIQLEQDKPTVTATEREIRRGSSSISISGSASLGRTLSPSREHHHHHPLCNLPSTLSHLFSTLRPDRPNRFSASPFPSPSNPSPATSASHLPPSHNQDPTSLAQVPFRNIYDFSQGPRPLRYSASSSPSPSNLSETDSSVHLLSSSTQDPTGASSTPRSQSPAAPFRGIYDLSQGPRPLKVRFRGDVEVMASMG
jgi:hypothetical protein